MRVLIGHCNPQRHKKTTDCAESSLSPKCSLENETPNHHVDKCKLYQNIRVKHFGQRWSRGHKARGQGQGHKIIPRPRTKDTAASVLQKQKRPPKSFSGNLQFIGVARIFDWGGLNYKSHAMTSSKICLLALNQDFAKGKSLN